MSARKQIERTGVLFVCLGNICRSPLAEGVFLHLAHERGMEDRFHVDSCGTGGWHVGERPDHRSVAVAKKHGVKLPSRARKLDPFEDFDRFHWLIAMDSENEREMLTEGAPRERVRLLRSFDVTLSGAKAADLDVPDPYYGGVDGFDQAFSMIQRACAGMLDAIC